jgi:hypothetical protein
MTDPSQPAPVRPRRNLPPPGLAGIACLLLIESGVLFFGMLYYLQARSLIALPIFISTLITFIGGAALLRQLRWGWAIALANALIAMTYYLFAAVRMHIPQLLTLSALHLIFFLYLVRPAVRERLR